MTFKEKYMPFEKQLLIPGGDGMLTYGHKVAMFLLLPNMIQVRLDPLLHKVGWANTKLEMVHLG